MTGTEILVKSLEHAGVQVVFGMPGAHLLELTDSIIDSPIRNILITSELSAAFMADGYARATGKVGTCIAIPGPGLTNMITGLAEALVDSSPLVLVVVGIDQSEKAFHLHEIKQLETVRPVVKKIITIQMGTEIPSGIAEAFYLAADGEPGPVVVEIPRQILRGTAEYRVYSKIDRKGPTGDDQSKIAQITDMLINARLCGIYAGKGALSASEQVKHIAELLSIPVATNISGKGVIPEDHELAVGFGFGPSGSSTAEKIFNQCDVVLALGCKFSEMSTGKWFMKVPSSLIHIDTNRDVFNKNYPATITLCEDIAYATGQILRGLKGVEREKNVKLIEQIKREKTKELKKGKKPSQGKIHPSRFFYQLRNVVSRDTVLVTDCGNHQLWAILDWVTLEPRTFITPSDYQAMGFGIPAAIGASIGSPNKQVICICGDGGFLISGFEILTALREKRRVAIVIFNDRALGLIKIMQQKIYGRTESVDFECPDYSSLAQAFGSDYIEIRNEEELLSGLKKMAACEKTVLVNVEVEYNEWPKYIKGIAKSTWKAMSLGEKVNLISTRVSKLFKN